MNDLNRMKQLAGILTESVTAVPGLNEKSTSEKQARFMAAAAHDPDFAKKTGMDADVAKEFNKADTGTKQLSNAMKHKGNTNESIDDEFDDDEFEEYDDEDLDDRSMFADPGGESALRASSETNPRIYSCPTCDRPNVLTRLDRNLGYQCDSCASADEGGMHNEFEESNDSWPDDAASRYDGDQPDPAEQTEFDKPSDTDDNFTYALTILQNLDGIQDEAEALEIVAKALADNGLDSETISGILADLADYISDGSDDEIGDGMTDAEADADTLASAGWGTDEDYGDYGDEDLEEDLNNGYDNVKSMTPDDYFPNGADSPATKNVGPSGAHQGDNPEQKKMAVAEMHKELVYSYRSFLKESSKLTPKKKINENNQKLDLSIKDYIGDFTDSTDLVEYSGPILVSGKIHGEHGNISEVSFFVDINATADVEWENDEIPTGYNYGNDTITYSPDYRPIIGTPEVTSVAFSEDTDFTVNNEEMSLHDAQKLVGSGVLTQLLNPALYTELLLSAFEKRTDQIPMPEPDFYEPERSDRDY